MFAVTFNVVAPTTPLRARRPSPSARRASVTVTAKAADDNEVYIGKARGVYSGKGRFIKDDPSKYAGRDDWFTGGWPGGEVALKESFIQEAFDPVVESSPLRSLPEDVKGEDTVYLGKGKFAKADAKKFAGRDDKGWFTGGWAGGEIALKNGEQMKLKPGDYVAIKNGGGFFSFLSNDTRKTGTVKKVESGKSGKVTVTVTVLPFDNVEEFSGDQLVKIDNP